MLGDDRTRPSLAPSATGSGLALLFALGTKLWRVRVPFDGREIVIGRDPECAIRLEHPSVSRRHAVLSGSPCVVRDLGSTNGTRLSGEKLGRDQQKNVTAGAVLEIGDLTAFVQAAKPDDPDALHLAPDAWRGGELSSRRRAPPSHTENAVVLDAAMVDAYELIDVVAGSKLPVLILGETGTGKDVYAEALHRASTRKKKPFLRLNCAALPEALLEAELFGFERGAFTGAVSAKAGLLEAAHEGTVFLDEIGETPPATQAKLLRVLESGEVLRIGSLRPHVIDVRIVSATHRELDKLAAEGAFRSDLFYRLNGIAVWLPPLRARTSEIIPLADLFLRRAGVSAPLTPDARAKLLAHAWPGNVRELKNVVERAALLARGGAIDAAHVQLGIPRPVTAGKPAAAAAPDLASVEKERILTALERHGGNRTRAATELGISRNKLLRKLETYGIGPRGKEPA